ncbi:MAG: acylphosphatase [Rhodospirillaceae bacterium]|jgi:acylphosphatase
MSNADIVTVWVSISGRVQRVGFRYWVIDQAGERGLNGWVRNVQAGDVEAVFSGARADVEMMIALCHDGPANARVDSVQQKIIDESPEQGFHYLPTV